MYKLNKAETSVSLEEETTDWAKSSGLTLQFIIHTYLLSIILSKYLRNIYSIIIALGGFKYTHRKEPVWQRKQIGRAHV